MKLRATLRLLGGVGLAAGLAGACSKDKAEPAATADPAEQTEATTTVTSQADDEVGKKSERPKAEELLANPVERRLYSNHIEASSFAWGNYNRFHENYHPSYMMDGDPVTTWLEDAEGNGIGEWVRINTSPIAGTTKLRLRMQNGYHKSESLFKKNSRVKAMEIKILPNGPVKRLDVEDSMEWQELEMGFAETEFTGIELKMLEAHGGTKYEDLCISDVELYVTGKTPENPAFEAKKLAELKEWKAGRLAAAKMFEGAAASELPIHSGYRVEKGEEVPKVANGEEFKSSLALLASLGTTADADPAFVARAKKALEEKFAGWKYYRPVVKNALKMPDVDGLVSFRLDRGIHGYRADVVELPALRKGKTLAQNRRIALFDAKRGGVKADNECERGNQRAQRPAGEVGPNASELVVWRCFEEVEREGMYRYWAWELLEYDANGWLRLAVSPQSARVFTWKKGDAGMVLETATQLARYDRNLRHLSPITKVAQATPHSEE